jgi:hypothetical protein
MPSSDHRARNAFDDLFDGSDGPATAQIDG